MNTVQLGDVVEAIVLSKLTSDNNIVLLPWGNNQRFDFVIYKNYNFIRVQVKHGRIKNNIIEASARSTNYRKGKWVSFNYKNDVDVIIIYVSELRKFYWLPIDEIGEQKQLSLRLKPPKNNQVKNIRFAEKYEF